MAETKSFKKTNLDDIRKKYQNITAYKEASSTEFFSTDNGTYIIRLLPSIGSSYDPFVMMYYHKKLGAKRDTTLVCPTSYSASCALCEYRFKLLNTKDIAQAEIAKQFKSKSKSYCNILVKGFSGSTNPTLDPRTLIKEDDFKVFVYGLHWDLYKTFMEYLANPMFGDITDIKEGRDFVYTISDNKSSGYRNHDLKPFPTPTSISENPELIEKVKSMMGNLDIFKKEVNFEDTKRLLDETLYGEGGNVLGSFPSADPVKKEVSVESPKKKEEVIKKEETSSVSAGIDTAGKKMKCFGEKYKEIDPVCSYCPDKISCEQLVKKLA